MRSLTIVVSIALLLAGCSSGAVVFAPTAPPPDTSALRYTHPSGAFTVDVPRNWPVTALHTTTLAMAAFSSPGDTTPSLRFTVVNLGRSVDSQILGDIIDRYSAALPADAVRYTVQDRSAMGDGSWRLTGLVQTSGDYTEQLNTFIQATGSFIGLAEVRLPTAADAETLTQLQTIINTFTINPQATLQAVAPDSLVFNAQAGLDLLHLTAWTTPAGVFFITGEVANYGTAVVTNLPIHAVLKAADGLVLAEAVDTVMGYGVQPGAFAPFSLRFGQGQPSEAVTYDLVVGGEGWQPDTSSVIYGPDELTWTDESSFTTDGQLIVSGTVTNISTDPVRNVRVVASVFGGAQNVIAAAFSDLPLSPLMPGETVPFQVIMPEMGGEPVNYIVNVQGQP
ncbi:MAG: hypothetical protein H6672_19145 [Anaerolineaceae bacterium]|nr:hypothetical protein [Anaerolineaceae bacterium]